MNGSPREIHHFETATSIYLDSASYGLPPKATVAAVTEALRSWSTGEAKWFADWDPIREQAGACSPEIDRH